MPLDIFFLNVGHGDCTVVDFPNRLTVVDVNNSKAMDTQTDSELLEEILGSSLKASFAKAAQLQVEGRSQYEDLLVDPVEFLNTAFPGRGVFRFIATHPDMDHLSGVYNLFSNPETRKVLTNCWTIQHSKDFSSGDFENNPRFSELDWLCFKLLETGKVSQGGGTTIDVKTLKLEAGANGHFYIDDGISILSPTSALLELAETKENWNLASYVLRIQYGRCVIILGGDAEAETWASITDRISDDDLKCNLLKASHHGRESGYSSDAVTIMEPDNVVLSVGKKPSTDAQQKYKDHTDNVFSTRYHGTIHARCWQDGDVWLFNSSAERIN